MANLKRNFPAILDSRVPELWAVSDIHGMGEVFFSILERWQEARQEGRQIHLVFLGDLVHRYAEGKDASLEILRALVQLEGEPITCLLGNHELMHLYHLQVQRAGVDYIRPLESAMGTERGLLMQFVSRWPVAVRWHNILFHHVGASKRILRTDEIPSWPFFAHWNHADLLQKVVQKGSLVTDSDIWSRYDPRIGDTLLATRTGKFLWDSYFLKNEMHVHNYESLVAEMLDVYSFGCAGPLQYLVTGHIPAVHGHTVIGRQLRICSAWGADEPNRRVLVLRNAPDSMEQLVHSLVPTSAVR